MPDAGWVIRFYEANNYTEKGTVDFTGNFRNTQSRQLDTVTAFCGMYGIDNYLVWNIHKNLPNYDFSTVALNLRLLLYKNTEIIYFQDFYRVYDVKYNPNSSQYTLFAISETTIILHKRLISYGVTSLSYKENRTAKDIIKEVINDNDIFHVVFHDDSDSTKAMVDYEYRYFDIDPEWTVIDFIQYIANDNKYEWCVDKLIDEDNVPHWILHIGHELKPYQYRNATNEFNPERDNVSNSLYTMKISTVASPMEPLAHWEENWKCIWAKHTAGKKGGITRGCFVPTGMGHFDKFLYLRTLEGKIEKDIGFSLLNKGKKRISSIGIGNITKDEGDSQFIDIVSIQKNPQTHSIREPHNIIINRGDDLAVQHQLERATRSTPYLDHNAGLFFPSPKLNEDEPPPNSLIFNIDGKRESAVVGPYIYGDGRIERDEEGQPTGEPKLIIPFKESKGDFRLQFPNGWCMYVDEAGNTIIQTDATVVDAKPSGDTDKTFIKLNVDGTIDINTNNKNVTVNQGGFKVALEDHKHGIDTHIHEIPPGPAIPGPPVATSGSSTPFTNTDPSTVSKNFKVEKA